MPITTSIASPAASPAAARSGLVLTVAAVGMSSLLLAGCTTPPQTTQDPMAQAVTAPLSDLNIVRAEIPPALRAAQQAPYALPGDRGCAALGAEIQALDAVLGADLDRAAAGADPGLVERAGGAVGDAAVGAVRGATESVVPFRRWVRRLTGAERYAREVNAAIAAGTIRRAFLKGLGQAAGCGVPAAPVTSATTGASG